MPSPSLPASLIGWLLNLPALSACLLFGLLCLLSMMIVCPLVIDWLGVKDQTPNPLPHAHRRKKLLL